MKLTIRSRTWDRRSFFADMALNAAANILLAGLGMVSGVLAARLLGPHGRGELAAIQTWSIFIAGLAALGMPEALVYFSAREPTEAGRYLSTAILVGVISSLPFVAAGYMLMPWLLHAQSPEIVRAGRWYLLVVPILSLIVLPRQSMQGRSDFISWNAMRMAPSVLWLGVLVLAWTCSRADATFVAEFNLLALALLIVPLGAFAICRIPGPFRPDSHKWQSLLGYGFPCMISIVPQTLNGRLDQMLMAAMLPAAQLGLYVVAVAWSGAVCPLLGALAAVTGPTIASAADDDRVQCFAIRIRAAAALAVILTVVVAAITPSAIVLLFGSAFKSAIPVTLVMVVTAGEIGFDTVLEEGLRGLGQPYAVLQAELAGLCVTALALTVLLLPIGIMGAAISSLLGYAMVTAVLLLNARRHAGTAPKDLLFLTNDEFQRAFEMLVALAQRTVPSD